MNNSDAEKYKSTIDLSQYNDPRVIIFNFIKENSQVLDVGCACGDLGFVLKKYKNCTIYGFEYNIESIKVAKKTNAYEDISQINLDDIDNYNFLEYKKKFDYIVCGDVLEHLKNPMHVLEILKMYLNDNGKIIASIPNIAHASIKGNLLLDDFTYTYSGLLDETHIHFFTYKTIAKYMSDYGWKISDCLFTYMDITGWHPHNPFNSLSYSVKRMIFFDWHSFVCQYVIKIVPSTDDVSILYEHNLKKLNVNKHTAPSGMKKYRSYIILKLYKNILKDILRKYKSYFFNKK